MKYFISTFLFTFLLLVTSCDKGPAIHPALKLVKGDKYDVSLDVNTKDQTNLVTADLADEKQRFTIGYEWEVIDIISDTEYIIRSTITAFHSTLKRNENYDDGIIIGQNDSNSSITPILKDIPLDSVMKRLVSKSFDFHITKSGEITEVHGADSAIYNAFKSTYQNEPETNFENDYYLIKSLCGNGPFSDFVGAFFWGYSGKDGWHVGYDFSNTSPMHEQLETINTDFEFCGLNTWKCIGKDSLGNYQLSLKGEFTNQTNNLQSKLNFNLKATGTQTGSIRYDTLSFLPSTGLLDQNYELSSGMKGMFVSFKIISYKVNRTLQLKIQKKN
jgi:hypothetical protein